MLHRPVPGSSSTSSNAGRPGSAAVELRACICARPPAPALTVRVAQPAEFWPSADLHCRVFFGERKRRGGGVWEQVQHDLARVDRCLALQANELLAATGAGR